MKNITITSILWIAIALHLHGQAPIPSKSTLKINMTQSLEKRPKNKGGGCYGTLTNYSLDPIFIRGKDLTDSAAVLSLYILSSRKNEKRKIEYSISNPICQLISTTPEIPLVKHAIQELKWQCSCCRDSEKIPVPIWYAEVRQDGMILCSNQSETDPEFQKAIETRTAISESEASSLPPPSKSTRTPIKLYDLPINITRGEHGEKQSTLGVKTNDVILISTPSGSKALVQFTKFEGAEGYYRWRFYDGKSRTSQSGLGDVSETQRVGKIMIATDKEKVVRVGGIVLDWSRGWLYYSQSAATLEIKDPSTFDKPF